MGKAYAFKKLFPIETLLSTATEGLIFSFLWAEGDAGFNGGVGGEGSVLVAYIIKYARSALAVELSSE